MAIEVLTIEVGSTITKVIGFARLPGGGFSAIARGFAPTSLADVGIGVDQALADLKQPGSGRDFYKQLCCWWPADDCSWLTASDRQSRQGSGPRCWCTVKLVTVGPLDNYQLDDIKRISPNLILLAGG